MRMNVVSLLQFSLVEEWDKLSSQYPLSAHCGPLFVPQRHTTCTMGSPLCDESHMLPCGMHVTSACSH
ncbi:hypothetical protein LZ31DRAFT_281515 [Colletotrichum somersetense]|nr:hypothetical protein LZ31DRAFT_281515 [Colletotrichum somersetense]